MMDDLASLLKMLAETGGPMTDDEQIESSVETNLQRLRTPAVRKRLSAITHQIASTTPNGQVPAKNP
jgi:hypothetical protein